MILSEMMSLSAVGEPRLMRRRSTDMTAVRAMAAKGMEVRESTYGYE